MLRALRCGLALSCCGRCCCGWVPLLTPTASSSAEHLHHATKAIDQGFRWCNDPAALVLPFAGLQLAFEVKSELLFQIFTGDLCDLAHEHHAMPVSYVLSARWSASSPPAHRWREMLVTAAPRSGVTHSGSCPRLPIRVTLFSDAIFIVLSFGTILRDGGIAQVQANAGSGIDDGLALHFTAVGPVQNSLLP